MPIGRSPPLVISTADVCDSSRFLKRNWCLDVFETKFLVDC